jgi:pimeloyl-ACP methyl ester carboxylesterase
VLRRIIAAEAGEPDYVFGTDRPLPATPIVLDDIWMFDDANHGASVDLNAGLLGPGQIWDDTARDLLNFIVHVLPGAKEDEKIASACFPWHLPWQLPWRPDGAYPPVKVIGFGASFGGMAQVRAAAAAPDRYAGIFLADPMLPPRTRSWEGVLAEPEVMLLRVRQALKRRDTWASREEARASLLASPFYAAFHPEAFDLVVSHGLVGAPGGVTLATPAWSEAAVFCEGVAHARGWDRMPGLRVPIAFFMARENDRTMGDELTREIVWRAPLARNERSLRAGHLLVQEDPVGTAEAAKRFLATLASGRWGNSPEEIRASYDEEAKARL